MDWGTFSYQWQRDGMDIAGATNPTYTLGSDDVGTSLTVTVSYADGDGTSESLTSAATATIDTVELKGATTIYVDNDIPFQSGRNENATGIDNWTRTILASGPTDVIGFNGRARPSQRASTMHASRIIISTLSPRVFGRCQ